MNKIWIGSHKKDTSIIALQDGILYYGKANEEEQKNILFDLQLKKAPKKLFSLPLTYIRAVHFPEKNNFLDVVYRENSSDQLMIHDQTRKEEIFEHLKTIRPDIVYSVHKLNKWQAAKKPLIALGLMTALFLWALYLAIQISYGANYEIVGSPGSITGIVLGIATYGVTKVSLVFVPLIAIALAASIRKMKQEGEIHTLTFSKK